MNAPAAAPAPPWVGRVLVTLQFSLLAAMAWRAATAGVPFDGAAGRAAAGLLLAAVALGLWTLSANRPGNFNIRPEPRCGGVLVTTGPYRWIRHPMYAAVLLAAAAAAAATGGLVDALLWGALLAVLWVKAGVEERALLRCFAGYAAYRARTRRLLPGLV